MPILQAHMPQFAVSIALEDVGDDHLFAVHAGCASLLIFMRLHCQQDHKAESCKMTPDAYSEVGETDNSEH